MLNKKLVNFVCWLLLSVLPVQAVENPGFTAGKALANIEKEKSITGGQSIADLLPGYNQTLPQEGFYSSNGNLRSQSDARKLDCSINPNQNGSVTAQNECTAINFLTNDPARVSDRQTICRLYTSETDQSKIPLECQNLPPLNPAANSGGNSFLATIKTDPSVILFGTRNQGDVAASFNATQGNFSACTPENVTIAPPVIQQRTCTVEDEITTVRCSWDANDPLGRMGACKHLEENPLCEPRLSGIEVQGDTCTAWSVPVPLDPLKPNGPKTEPKCLGMNTNYACAKKTPRTDQNCTVATSPNCSRVSAQTNPLDLFSGLECLDSIKQNCIHANIVYQCKEQDGRMATVQNCQGQKYCVGDNCLDTPSTPSLRDMVATVGVLEAARQAGTYKELNSSDFRIFAGVASFCQRKFLKNCCIKTNGTVSSNRSVMSTIGMAVVGGAASYYGGQAITAVSGYVYDFMYNANIFAEWAMDGLMSQTIAAGAALTGGTTLGSVYGLTVWTGATPTTGLFGNTLTQLGSSGGFNFAFDPYSLMFSIALQVLMAMLSCDQEDYSTNQKYQGGLCNYVGEFCSKRWPIIGGCMNRKQSYCCYNSKLAKQVKAPMDLAAAMNPQSPGCQGLTVDEFSNINFETLDLSDFYSEIAPAAFDGTSASTRANEKTGELINGRIFK